MIGLLSMGNLGAPHDVGSFGEYASLENLYRVTVRKIRRKKLRRRKLVLSNEGTFLSVDLVIHMIDGPSVEPRELESILRECCSEYFEYAISTSHAKTILCGLYARDGRPIGDLTASFQPHQSSSRTTIISL